MAAIEVNVSCPNVLEGGAVFGADAEKVADVTSAVRRATTLPLIVKLSPNSGDVRPTALAAASSGADAISLINTITGMGIDISKRRPTLANVTGGLSGPAIKPIALRMVYEVAARITLNVSSCSCYRYWGHLECKRRTRIPHGWCFGYTDRHGQFY